MPGKRLEKSRSRCRPRVQRLLWCVREGHGCRILHVDSRFRWNVFAFQLICCHQAKITSAAETDVLLPCSPCDTGQSKCNTSRSKANIELEIFPWRGCEAMFVARMWRVLSAEDSDALSECYNWKGKTQRQQFRHQVRSRVFVSCNSGNVLKWKQHKTAESGWP